MNDSDNDANTKSVDSLLNFETVKYFGNEQHGGGALRRAMERYEAAAIQIWTSLSWLNIGQAVIFTIGMTMCMVMSGTSVIAASRRSAISS